MPDCRNCKHNGIQRDGGDIGLCHACVRKKCHTCLKPSAGRNLCTNCEFGEQLDRQLGQAKEPWFHDEDSYFDLRFREELMWQAKRLVLEAVAMAWRGFALTLAAFWGGYGRSEKIPPQAPAQAPDIKKAA